MTDCVHPACQAENQDRQQQRPNPGPCRYHATEPGKGQQNAAQRPDQDKNIGGFPTEKFSNPGRRQKIGHVIHHVNSLTLERYLQWPFPFHQSKEQGVVCLVVPNL